MKKHYLQGFSLIELMIALAIVGILGAIAYPSYTSSVLKGKRAQGRSALAELMQQQERYLTQNNVYFAFTNTAGVTTPTSTPFKTFSGDSPTEAGYYLSAAACTGATLSECVELRAAPRHSDPDYGSLIMHSTGSKTCTGPKKDNNKCWK